MRLFFTSGISLTMGYFSYHQKFCLINFDVYWSQTNKPSDIQTPRQAKSIYIFCLSVCEYPNIFKTAEPGGPKFLWQLIRIQGKYTYGWVELKKFPRKIMSTFAILKIHKLQRKIFENGRLANKRYNC